MVSWPQSCVWMLICLRWASVRALLGSLQVRGNYASVYWTDFKYFGQGVLRGSRWSPENLGRCSTSYCTCSSVTLLLQTPALRLPEHWTFPVVPCRLLPPCDMLWGGVPPSACPLTLPHSLLILVSFTCGQMTDKLQQAQPLPQALDPQSHLGNHVFLGVPPAPQAWPSPSAPHFAPLPGLLSARCLSWRPHHPLQVTHSLPRNSGSMTSETYAIWHSTFKSCYQATPARGQNVR